MDNLFTLDAPLACPACGFTSRDLPLLTSHSCRVQDFGGYCEDFPACGHEAGDCNGELYGSDEAIKARAYAQLSDPDYDPYYDDYDY